MNLTSSYFFLLLLFSTVCFYLFQKKQKAVLLVTSIMFFVCAMKFDMKYVIELVLIIIATWLGGIFIGRSKGCLRTLFAAITVGLLVLGLVVLKYLCNVGTLFFRLMSIDVDLSFLEFIAPIGMSYFTLSAIGYVLDVFWESYDPVKNPVDVALFIMFFPQLVSGPVTRMPEMIEQFNARHSLDWDGIKYSLRRMLFGYFKKLVIADRLGIIVRLLYKNPLEQDGCLLFTATLFYALQLYADFSGCMDIILGSAHLYGISLPENFDAPFMSRSVPEFWRRWHISLGNWFRDYVMYPVQKSRVVQRLGHHAVKHLGKKKGRKIPFYFATLVLWALIGLWHGGTSYYFMASAILPCVYLLGSDFVSPIAEFLVKTCRVNTECWSWRFFQRLRTFFILLSCWVFVNTISVRKGIVAIKRMFFDLNLTHLKFSALDLNLKTAAILAVGLGIMLFADVLKNRKKNLYVWMNEQNAVFRGCAIYAEMILIVLFGVFADSSFIYFKF